MENPETDRTLSAATPATSSENREIRTPQHSEQPTPPPVPHNYSEISATDIPEQLPPLKRAGFITFWLWFCIVFNAISIIYGIIIIASDSIYYTGAPTILGFLSNCAALFGFGKLLHWEKSGFYIASGANFIIALIQAAIASDPYIIFVSAILITILYAILQIKYADISYWDAMDEK